MAVKCPARFEAVSYPKLLRSSSKLLAVVAVVVVATYFLAQEEQPLNRVVSAQEGPVIHSVEPERPDCIVLNSDVPSHRVLAILGEGLAATPGSRLQFQLPGTNNLTILFGLEVDWGAQTGSRWI